VVTGRSRSLSGNSDLTTAGHHMPM